MRSELAVRSRYIIRYHCAGLAKISVSIIWLPYRFDTSKKRSIVLLSQQFPDDSGFALSDISTVTVWNSCWYSGRLDPSDTQISGLSSRFPDSALTALSLSVQSLEKMISPSQPVYGKIDQAQRLNKPTVYPSRYKSHHRTRQGFVTANWRSR